MSKFIINALFFLSGVLVHLVFSTIYLTPPIKPPTDFDFKLSSEYLNDVSPVCSFLKESGCGCNLVIETHQRCQVELEQNIGQQIKDGLWEKLLQEEGEK